MDGTRMCKNNLQLWLAANHLFVYPFCLTFRRNTRAHIQVSSRNMYKRLTKKNKTTNDNHVFVFHASTNNLSSPSSNSQNTITNSSSSGGNRNPYSNNIILRPPRVNEHPNSINRKKKRKPGKSSASKTYDELNAKFAESQLIIDDGNDRIGEEGADEEYEKPEIIMSQHDQNTKLEDPTFVTSAETAHQILEEINASKRISFAPTVTTASVYSSSNHSLQHRVPNPVLTKGPAIPDYPSKSSSIAYKYAYNNTNIQIQRENVIRTSKSMTLPAISNHTNSNTMLPSVSMTNIDDYEALASTALTDDTILLTAMDGTVEKLGRATQKVKAQQKEIRSLKSENKQLKSSVLSLRKRSDYLKKRARELQLAAKGNHQSAIQAEVNATVHSANAQALKEKYISVQAALEICREEHDRIIEKEDVERKLMQEEKRRLGGAFRQNNNNDSAGNKRASSNISATKQAKMLLQETLGVNNGQQRESRKSAEKAYKRALMLLVKEKGEVSRQYNATKLVKDRLQRKAEDLEVRLEKAHAEIKRLRTLYKTSQKALEAQRPTTAVEREQELEEARKRPVRISKQAPLTIQMNKIFEGENALLNLLLQAREDGDADEIARATMRCRAMVLLNERLMKANTLENVCTAVLDILPLALECEYGILQIYEDETNTYWTVPRRSGGRGYFPMSKKSLAYQVFKKCDGVFGSVDTRCVISTPVIATSSDNVDSREDSIELSKSLPHRKHTLALEKQRHVVGVLQAFNKRLRQNTGLHANDVQAQAHAASFDNVDIDVMNVCCGMLTQHIKRIEAALLVDRQFSYLTKLSDLSLDCFRSYLPPIPSIEEVDPVKLARGIEQAVGKLLHVSGVRIFIVGVPPGHPASHPISGPLGSQRLEQAIRSREQIKLLSKAMHIQNKKDEKRKQALGLSSSKATNATYRRRLKQHNNLGLLLQVWHVRKDLDYNMQMTEQRKYTDLFSGISGHVLQTRQSSVVRDAYNDAMFNGNSDLYINGSDLLSCPIADHNGRTVGVLQVAVTDLIELEEISNMNLMVPKNFDQISRQADLHGDVSSSSSSESDSDSDGSKSDTSSKASYVKLRNKRRQENIARYIMEKGAIRVLEDICSKLALLLIHFRDVSSAMMHNVLESEDELIKVFKLWTRSKQQIEFEEKRKFENLSADEQAKVMFKRKHVAATKIQYQIRKFLKKRLKQKNIACIQIQRIARGFLSRQRVKKIRRMLDEEQEALWSMAESGEV